MRLTLWAIGGGVLVGVTIYVFNRLLQIRHEEEDRIELTHERLYRFCKEPARAE